jgi:U3 small nucleolar RNA-associated protein 23
MKAAKYRRNEHWMQVVYGRGLGMRAPHPVLVDATFCRASLRHKFDISTRLSEILAAPVRPLITGCILSAIRTEAAAHRKCMGHNADPLIADLPAIARKIELRRCAHNPPLSALECIKKCIHDGLKLALENEAVGGDPQKKPLESPFDKTKGLMRFMVATDDNPIKQLARSIPGVPLIYIERTFPLLEAPTPATLELARNREALRRGLMPGEDKVIQTKVLADAHEKPSLEPLHKRKRAKAPNPLSVKKPKARPDAHSNSTASNDAGPKRKRKRRSTKNSNPQDSS